MMAVFRFEKTVSNYNKKIKEHNQKEGNELKKEILPILGCTFNVCQDRLNKKRKDKDSQVVFLAKNKEGYQNLIKLASIAYTEGFYYVPRIDKSVIQDYKNDLIVLSRKFTRRNSATDFTGGRKSGRGVFIMVEGSIWRGLLYGD